LVGRVVLAPEVTGFRISRHGLLASTLVFVAVLEDGRVIGTVSLVVDSSAGLPMDALYPGELEARRRHARLAEVKSLAVERSYRHAGVVHLLTRMIVGAATAVGCVDELVMAAHPRTRAYYARTWLFAPFGPERGYQGFGKGALAVAMRVRVVGLEARLALHFNALGGEGDALLDLLDPDEPAIQSQAEFLRAVASPERRHAQAILAETRPDVAKSLGARGHPDRVEGLLPLPVPAR
jgi:hypothetical protein